MRRVVNYIRVGYSSISYTMFILCRDIRCKPLPELLGILRKKLEEDEVSFEGHQPRIARDRGPSPQPVQPAVHIPPTGPCNRVRRRDPGEPNRSTTTSTEGQESLRHRAHLARQLRPYAHEFESSRNSSGAQPGRLLLLLPADVNRSLQAKPFEEKTPVYAKQNAFAGSLDPGYYDHQPRLKAYRDTNGLPFKPYGEFGRREQDERSNLVLRLAHEVWSPDRLDEVLP